MALHNAGEPVALRCSAHVHEITGLEHGNIHLLPQGKPGGLVFGQSELSKGSQGSGSGFRQMSLDRFGELSFGDGIEPQLNRGVSVGLRGLDLGYETGTRLDDGHGDAVAVHVEKLCHPHLLSDDSHHFPGLSPLASADVPVPRIDFEPSEALNACEGCLASKVL